MIIPEVKNIILITDDYDCIANDFWIPIQVDIGQLGKEGAEIFTFYIADCKRIDKILQKSPAIGCRGLIIVKEWNEKVIHDIINFILSSCKGENWVEVANKISRYGIWEYEYLQKN